MARPTIKSILYIILVLFVIACGMYTWLHDYDLKQEAKVIYEKEQLTEEDIKFGSTFSGSSSSASGEEGENPPTDVRYKKLYGVEHIGNYDVEKDGGITVEIVRGENVKILILDENGNERFYDEVYDLDFDPGEAGSYDLYFVAKKFTGRACISTY